MRILALKLILSTRVCSLRTCGGYVWNAGYNNYIYTAGTYTHTQGSGSDDKVDYYVPDVLTSNDYYPFGMRMEGRGIISSEGYRYGYNGQEKDNEVKGDENAYDFGGRSIYDGRLSRFISIDPRYREFPAISPYSYAANNPILFSDENGEGPIVRAYYTFDQNYKPVLERWEYVSNGDDRTSTEVKVQYCILKLQNNPNADKYYQIPESLYPGGDVMSWMSYYGANNKPVIKGVEDFNFWWYTVMSSLPITGQLVAYNELKTGKNLYSGEPLSNLEEGFSYASFVPMVGFLKVAENSVLIPGKIAVKIEKGSSILVDAYKFGKLGWEGSSNYTLALNWIRKGGNYVAESKEQALELLKKAFPNMPLEEVGKQSKFGYRIEDVVEDAATTGHTGWHINYYDKANKVRGTILIDKQ